MTDDRIDAKASSGTWMISLSTWPDNSVTAVQSSNSKRDLFDQLDQVGDPFCIVKLSSMRMREWKHEYLDTGDDLRQIDIDDGKYFNGCSLLESLYGVSD